MSDLLITFIISVAAGVVSYYICKWLDRQHDTLSLGLKGIAHA